MNFKVLIIAAGLHQDNGTGITLTHLFRAIPKDDICIITNYENAIRSLQSGYNNVFILEYGLTASQMQSQAMKDSSSKNEKLPRTVHPTVVTILKGMLRYAKQRLQRWGLYYPMSKHRLNNKLIEWINEQKPTVIYSLSFHIAVTLQIQKHYGLPIVLHIMDDWITTEVPSSILSWFWRHKLKTELLQIICHSSAHIAISEKMSREYKSRYGKHWHVFHNPLEIDKWLVTQKTSYQVDKVFRMAFFGRITSANSGIMGNLIDSVEKINTSIALEFHIYSQKLLTNTKKVIYHEFVEHSMLPKIMPTFDLLVLPFYFDDKWNKYARLSMPTKVSEYMICGVPILLISPHDTALFEFCSKYQCAYCAQDLDKDSLKTSLEEILSNQLQRERTADIAKQIAVSKFDGNQVSTEFLHIFEDAIKERKV